MFFATQMKIENKFHRASWLKMGVGSQEDMGNSIKVRIIGLFQLIYFPDKHWPVMQITDMVSAGELSYLTHEKNKQISCGWVPKLGGQLHEKTELLQFYR